MKKIYILIITLIIFNQLIFAQKTLFVVPFTGEHISAEDKKIVTNISRNIFYSLEQYTAAFSIEIERKIIDQALDNPHEYFVSGQGSAKFYEVVQQTDVDHILSGYISYDGTKYTVYFKIRDAKTQETLLMKGFEYQNDFQKLQNEGLKSMIHSLFGIKTKTENFLSVSPSAGFTKKKDENSINYGLNLSYGSKKWGQIGIDINLYTDALAENIALVYETPTLFLLFLEVGIGFTSERNDGFSLTQYKNAPKKNKILSMQHSASIFTGFGFSIPVFKNLKIKPKIESDIIYCDWKTLDGKHNQGVIYSVYPELEINMLYYFKK